MMKVRMLANERMLKGWKGCVVWYAKGRNGREYKAADRLAKKGSKKSEVKYIWGYVCDKAV